MGVCIGRVGGRYVGAGICFSQGFLSFKCWINLCLSEIDKVMEKVRWWLETGREAWGDMGIFLLSQEKSVLFLTIYLFSPKIQEFM